jgi:hypothetical protein
MGIGYGSKVGAVSGQLTLRDALRIGVLVCDGAERGVSSILMDPSAVNGELSDLERYEVGKTLANYCMKPGWCYRVALLGSEPVVTGFGALVASNRGLVTKRFSDPNNARTRLPIALPGP